MTNPWSVRTQVMVWPRGSVFAGCSSWYPRSSSWHVESKYPRPASRRPLT